MNENQDFDWFGLELIEDKDMLSYIYCESFKEDDWEIIDTIIPQQVEEVKSSEIKIHETPLRSFLPFKYDLKRNNNGEKKETCSQVMNFSGLENCEKKCFHMLEKLSDLENSLKELYQDRLMKSKSQSATCKHKHFKFVFLELIIFF